MISLDYKSFNKISGIYKIYSIDKIYVGSATNLFQRISNHLSALKKGAHANRWLQNTFNKYGESYFNVDVLELTDILIEKEQYWIDTLMCIAPNGYNLCPLARSRKGIKQNIEAVKKTAEKNKGSKRSIETRLKMSQNSKRQSHSDEYKAKMAILTSKRLKGKPSKRKTSIIQLTLQNEPIKEWESITLASQSLNVSGGHISKCCKGKKNSIGGYKWKYKPKTRNLL